MGEKYFTVSYDDGTEQDIRVIALMEKYGIKGTFNISSGLFGKKSYIRLIDGRGRSAAFKDEANPAEYIDHFILSEQDALKLYSHPNVEVASHGTHHLVQTGLTPDEAFEEITRDVERLSELFGYQVVGHAFPKDTFNDNVLAALKNSGVRYARRVCHLQRPQSFLFDKNSFAKYHSYNNRCNRRNCNYSNADNFHDLFHDDLLDKLLKQMYHKIVDDTSVSAK